MIRPIRRVRIHNYVYIYIYIYIHTYTSNDNNNNDNLPGGPRHRRVPGGARAGGAGAA